MFKQLFDTREIDTLATWLAGELQRLLPPAEALAPGRKAADRLAKLDVQVARRLAELATGGHLNMYKKAKLGSRVQAALDEAGYPSEFSKRYVVDLVSVAAMAGRAPR